MAVTATTTLGASGYTPKATSTSGITLTTWYRPDPLKIKTGPNGSLIDYHNHTNTTMSNRSFTAYEVIDYSYGGTTKWNREWFNGSVAFCGYYNGSNYWTTTSSPNCTYGEVQITKATVTASRDSASSPTVKVVIDGEWYVRQAPIESYYNWQVYGFFSKPSGGEEQIMFHNRDKTWSATEAGSFTAVFSFTETSGNTTIANQKYGVWGNGNGVTYNMNPSMGISKTYTMNIPKYVASPIKQYNGSSWNTIELQDANTKAALAVKQYNGSNWVDL